MTLLKNGKLKPRRANLKPWLKTVPKFDPAAEELATDGDELLTSQTRIVANTQDIPSDNKQSSLEGETESFICVDARTSRATRNSKASRTQASTILGSPPTNHQPQSQSLNSLQEFVETMCRRLHEDAETTSHIIDQDNDERARLFALTISQHDEIVRLEENATRVSRQVEQAESDDRTYEEEYERGYSDGLAASVKTLNAKIEILEQQCENDKMMISLLMDRKRLLER